MKMMFDAPQIYSEFRDRILTLPISEDANTNFAVGASLIGVKPIVDVITADFLYRTMDSICNTAAKTDYLYPGRTIVIRAEFMTGGPTTGQRPEALFAHIPNLYIQIPSNPHQAAVATRKALEHSGVTIIFEDREIGDSWEMYYPDPKVDKKLTILSYGLSTRRLMLLREKIDACELFDLYDLHSAVDEIGPSLEKTHKLLIVEPDIPYWGIGAELSARIHERYFDLLDKPVKRLGMNPTVIPACVGLHEKMQPSDTDIVKTIEEMIA